MTSSPDHENTKDAELEEHKPQVTHRQLAHEVLLRIINRYDLEGLEVLIRDAADNMHDITDLPQSDVVKTLRELYVLTEGPKNDIFDRIFNNS